MAEVVLNRFEQMQAAHVGTMRRLLAIRRQRRDHYGRPAFDLWGMDIEAAGAELAVAKLTGCFWNALADDPASLPGDVGRFQVRYTHRPAGCLIVHRADPDLAPFVLVTGRLPSYTVRGQILGREAKQQRFWREGDGRPAYFVPAEALRPLEAVEAVAA